MPTLPTEQLSALQAANLDLLFGLTNKTFAGLQKLAELNLQTMKATVAETQNRDSRQAERQQLYRWPSALKESARAPPASSRNSES